MMVDVASCGHLYSKHLGYLKQSSYHKDLNGNYKKKFTTRKASAPSFAPSLRPVNQDGDGGAAPEDSRRSSSRSSQAFRPSLPFQWLKRCSKTQIHLPDVESSAPLTAPMSEQCPRRQRFFSQNGLTDFMTDSMMAPEAPALNSNDNVHAEDGDDRDGGDEDNNHNDDFLMFDCGCCSGQIQRHSKCHSRLLLRDTIPNACLVSDLGEAVQVINEMRLKFQCRGHQIIGYRAKIKQQKRELRCLKSAYQKQLTEIASQLLLFEASLRAKEKHLQETLQLKDQVISKQQRVIKRLLKKGYNAAAPAPEGTRNPGREEETLSLLEMPIEDLAAGTKLKDEELEYDAQNDSDSAVILEDGITEVSLAVPNLNNIRNGIGISLPDSAEANRVIRSVSDVVKPKPEQPKPPPPLAGRKTKEERRISNRQKLLLLKRHSGFLKRPEILETVYSVEEDGEQQQGCPQQAPPSTSGVVADAAEDAKLVSDASWSGRASLVKTSSVTSTDSPGTSRRSSMSMSCLLMGFRQRMDSDLTDDCSTDDESNRLFFCETDGSGGAFGSNCSCSQSCSRRSSYGFNEDPGQGSSTSCTCCFCIGCYCRVAATGPISASAPTSRRASYGSHSNKTAEPSVPAPTSAATQETRTFNRVMSNHRRISRPSDVKFRRINKAKARSLEELRDALKGNPMPESASADELQALQTSEGGTTTPKPASISRLAILRGILDKSAESSA